MNRRCQCGCGEIVALRFASEHCEATVFRRILKASAAESVAVAPDYRGHDDPREAAREAVFVRLPRPADDDRRSLSGTSFDRLF